MDVQKKNIVYFPQELHKEHYTGPVYGVFVERTGIYNILPKAVNGNISKAVKLGDVFTNLEDVNITYGEKLYGYWEDDSIVFHDLSTRYITKLYGLVMNVFSRNSGILESGMMESKKVVILGCGSVGSLVALELARSGVGNFLLIDNDIMEYHNICRHQCSISDIGDYKVVGLEKRILEINPFAKVHTQCTVVEEMSKSHFDQFCEYDNTIIVACADNRDSDIYGNYISMLYKVPFVSIGFWERAFAGEIFYQIPNKDMPCYKCALGDGSNFSLRNRQNHRFYTNEEDVKTVSFEPGISVDISFVTLIGVKLIIDILNEKNIDYTPRLLQNLQQYTLVCNTNDVHIGGPLAEIFSYPLQVTTSLKVSFGQYCPPCRLLR